MDLTILLIPLAAVIAPLLAALIGRVLVVPLVVFEIALGMLMGPSGLGWAHDDETLRLFSDVGLAMLFFMAGNEIDTASLRGRLERRSLLGWGASAVLALLAATVLGATVLRAPGGGFDAALVVLLAIALTGTALGTIMPILRDAGMLRGPLGAGIVSAGAVGEFAPLVAISVFLSGRQPIAGIIVLLVFAGVAALAFWLAAAGPRDWLRRMVTMTLRTSGQFAIRFVVLLLGALVTLALVLGVDFLLGAFTAGMLAKVVLQDGDPEELHVIEAKLESISFGFFVPLFFVATGVGFPLRELLGDPGALVLVPVFAVVMLLVRGIPGLWTPDRGRPLSERRAAALFTATTLPLVIAIVGIGSAQGMLDARTGAALVGGAMLTVLLFPMLALLGRRSPR